MYSKIGRNESDKSQRDCNDNIEHGILSLHARMCVKYVISVTKHNA
jgi:hypothetical protein